MPTASDYQAAASRLRRQGRRVRDTAARFATDTGDWLTGPLAERHADSVTRIRQHLVVAGTVLDHVATVAERRSIVCAAFADEVRRYERLDPWVRVLTPRPQRPAVWADA